MIRDSDWSNTLNRTRSDWSGLLNAPKNVRIWSRSRSIERFGFSIQTEDINRGAPLARIITYCPSVKCGSNLSCDSGIIARWVPVVNPHQWRAPGRALRRKVRRKVEKVKEEQRLWNESDRGGKAMVGSSTEFWNKFTPTLVSRAERWASWTPSWTTSSKELLGKLRDLLTTTRERRSLLEKSRLPFVSCSLENWPNMQSVRARKLWQSTRAQSRSTGNLWNKRPFLRPQIWTNIRKWHQCSTSELQTLFVIGYTMIMYHFFLLVAEMRLNSEF